MRTGLVALWLLSCVGAPAAVSDAGGPVEEECELDSNHLSVLISCIPAPATWSPAQGVTTIDFSGRYGVSGTLTLPMAPVPGRFVGGIDGVTCQLSVTGDGNPGVDSTTKRGTCVLTIASVAADSSIDGELALDALPDTVDGERVELTETF